RKHHYLHSFPTRRSSDLTVTAIKETLDKTNLWELKEGSFVNLERGMQLGARLDGHIVQGHVDQTGICSNITDKNGSWIFTFQYRSEEHTSELQSRENLVC